MGKSRAAFVSGILTRILEELCCHLLTNKIPTKIIAFKLNRGQKEHFICYFSTFQFRLVSISERILKQTACSSKNSSTNSGILWTESFDVIPSGGGEGMVWFLPQVAKPRVVGIMNSQRVTKGNFNSPSHGLAGVVKNKFLPREAEPRVVGILFFTTTAKPWLGEL